MLFCVSGHGVAQVRCAPCVVCFVSTAALSFLLFDRPSGSPVFHACVCNWLNVYGYIGSHRALELVSVGPRQDSPVRSNKTASQRGPSSKA